MKIILMLLRLGMSNRITTVDGLRDVQGLATALYATTPVSEMLGRGRSEAEPEAARKKAE